MTKIEIDQAKLDGIMYRMMLPRAHVALNLYRSARHKRDDSDYPFRRHPGQRSVRSLASAKIRPIPGGLRITIEAEGAYFLEKGNDAKGSIIQAPAGKKLYIPIKKRARRTGPKGLDPKAFVFKGRDGRMYLATRRVRAYKGRHLLERSVAAAFGYAAVRRG